MLKKLKLFGVSMLAILPMVSGCNDAPQEYQGTLESCQCIIEKQNKVKKYERIC